MQYAKDNYGLDPGWRYCPACDTDFPSGTRFVNGLCPACARERELADAAEEELADAMENENEERHLSRSSWRGSSGASLGGGCRGPRRPSTGERAGGEVDLLSCPLTSTSEVKND